jgi:hypothetical protein
MSILNTTHRGKFAICITHELLIDRDYVLHPGSLYRFRDNPLEELKFEDGPNGYGYYTSIWIGNPKTKIENLYQLEYLEKYWTAETTEQMNYFASMVDPKHTISNFC